MAIKGLSIPVVGNYTNTSGTVTYSNPLVADKAISYSLTVESGDDNPLYADNMIAENDKGTFQNGTLTLGTADIPQSLSIRLLGTKTVTDTVGADSVTVQVFDDDATPPTLGFGIIELHQVSDVDKYRAVFLNKVYFNIPENSATTKGESIEWQTPEIEGVVMRSDEVTADRIHPWMEDAWFDSEAAALAWLQFKCGSGNTPSA